jgi:hypothetical protein
MRIYPVEEAECQVDLLEGEGLYRVLRLSGPVDALLEYDLRRHGHEIVRVNEVERWHGSTMRGYSRYLEVPLPARGRLTALIECRASLWGAITGFRVWIGDDLAYTEGHFAGEEHRALPIPAEEALPKNEGYPRPAQAGEPDAGSFPLTHRGSVPPHAYPVRLRTSVNVTLARGILATVAVISVGFAGYVRLTSRPTDAAASARPARRSGGPRARSRSPIVPSPYHYTNPGGSGFSD